LSFHRSFGTPVAVLRPFNTFGPRQSARAVIPTIITQIAAGERRIRLGSLHPTRDFSYVSDTVRGFIRAAQEDSSIGEVINLGSNFEISIGDTAALIAERMQAEIEIVSDDQRTRPKDSEVERLWADNHLARERLGWVPAYGGRQGFARALGETIDWFTEPKNLRLYKHQQYNI
jgi:dTDP-glucose 4,6-dehydratase